MRRVTTMMMPSTTIRNTTAMRNIELMAGLMSKHMIKLNTRFSGARATTRRIIIKAFCTLVMSVVMRVTRPGTLNLSILEKEKVWMLA